MPKVTGNNRISALKRLGNPYSLNNLNRGPLIESKTSSINDARQILLNRNKTSFDARQLLTRQSSKTDDNNEKMVVITGLKDMKMKAGRVNQKFHEKKIILIFSSSFKHQQLEVLSWKKRNRFLLLDHLLLLLFVIVITIILQIPVRFS
jgi:hypothetical protein